MERVVKKPKVKKKIPTWPWPERPLKKIYDKALIGHVWAGQSPRCFQSAEDEEEPIAVYDLDKLTEIHFRQCCKEMPEEHPDAVREWAMQELLDELPQLRAIFVNVEGVKP